MATNFIEALNELDPVLQSYIEDMQTRLEDCELGYEEALQLGEQHYEKYTKFKLLHDKSPISLLILDEQGSIEDINEQGVNFLGKIDKNIILSARFLAYICLDKQLVWLNFWKKLITENEMRIMSLNTLIGINTNNGIKVTSISAQVVKHTSVGTKVLLAMIPMQHIEKETLKLDLYRRLFSEMREGVMITDKNANILEINPAFTDISDYRQIDAIGKKASILQSGRHDINFYQTMWQSLLERGFWEGEIWNKRKGGEVYPEWLSISALKDNSDEIEKFIGIFSDISSRKETERKIKHLAYFDSLTSLANRAHFMSQIEQLVRNQKEQTHFGLIYIDLDGFKRINDVYGHASGDYVLKESAQRMILQVRDIDLIARLGGDEFAILLRSAALESDLMIVANRLLIALQNPFVINGHHERVGASIGVLLYPDDASDTDILLSRGDEAMYAAKKEGKGRINRWQPK